MAGSAAAMSVVMTDPNQIAAAGAGRGRATTPMRWRWQPGEPDDRELGRRRSITTPTLYLRWARRSRGADGEHGAERSVTQLQTQNNALSSVNLNDEAAAMSTLETSYQAASQVFTMLNTIMASALNLGEQTAVS